MFQARMNEDGSITVPLLPEGDPAETGISVDGEITVHPGDDNYDEAMAYYISTASDPFAPADEEQP